MTYLYMTRHGETVWNVEGRFQGRENSELTERGILQAESLSRVLDEEGIELIVTSPLKRAFETARIARGARDIPIIKLDSLLELSLGRWEGAYLRELEGKDPDNFNRYWNDPFNFTSEGGESFPELIRRLEGALAEIGTLAEGRKVLVVTHGMSLMALLHLVTGTDFQEVMRKPVLRQASITKVRIQNGSDRIRYEVEYIGDTSHYGSEELKSRSPMSRSEAEKK